MAAAAVCSLAAPEWVGYFVGFDAKECCGANLTVYGFEVNGYATEAVKAFLPVIMPKLGIRKIAGICLADNRASVKVMERCGFVKEFEGVGPYQGEERNICKFVFSL